jgi:hypothetical protein
MGRIRNSDLPPFTFLIGFGSPDRHHQAVTCDRNVASIQRNKLWAPKCSTEADQ